jgi:hypothetical protein
MRRALDVENLCLETQLQFMMALRSSLLSDFVEVVEVELDSAFCATNP